MRGDLGELARCRRHKMQVACQIDFDSLLLNYYYGCTAEERAEPIASVCTALFLSVTSLVILVFSFVYGRVFSSRIPLSNAACSLLWTSKVLKKSNTSNKPGFPYWVYQDSARFQSVLVNPTIQHYALPSRSRTEPSYFALPTKKSNRRRTVCHQSALLGLHNCG